MNCLKSCLTILFILLSITILTTRCGKMTIREVPSELVYGLDTTPEQIAFKGGHYLTVAKLNTEKIATLLNNVVCDMINDTIVYNELQLSVFKNMYSRFHSGKQICYVTWKKNKPNQYTIKKYYHDSQIDTIKINCFNPQRYKVATTQELYLKLNYTDHEARIWKEGDD